MANAFLVKPLPMTVTANGGTSPIGSPSNLALDYAGLIYQVTQSGGVCGVAIDLGADTVIDTVLVFGVELMAAGATLYLYYSTAAAGPATGASPSDTSGSVYAGSVTPSNGKGVSYLAMGTPITARYLVVAYIGGGGSNPWRASRIVVGKRIQLSRNFSMGGAHGVKDLGSADFSRRGVLQRSYGAILRTRGLTFSNVKKDELESSLLPLIEYLGNTRMVALVTDPAVDAQRQNRCYFGLLAGDLGATQRNVGNFETKLNLVSIF